MPPPMQSSSRGHHRRSSSNVSTNDNDSSYNNNQNGNNNSRGHRRAQSSVASGNYQNFNKQDTRQQNLSLGHNRRHSLGISEAKKAAAEAQAQRSGHSPSKLSVPPTFKFPPSPKLESEDDSRAGFGNGTPISTNNERSPQRSFQFPPRDSSQTLAPPNPGFAGHERRQSGNFNHKSTGSDINGNWRKQQQSQQTLAQQQQNFEPPAFTPGHRVRPSYGGSISSISQLGGAQNGQRKSLFAPYLPQSSLPDLINEGKLVTGTLRVNKKNRSDAYVSTDGLLDADIFICGSKDRNRALEGDLVAIELLVVDEVWGSKREKEEKKRRKDNPSSKANTDINDDFHNDASTNYTSSSGTTDNNSSLSDAAPASQSPISKSGPGSLNRRGSLKQRPTQKKNDDVEVEGQSLLLVEEEEISDDCKPLYAGHVVAVVDRIPGQLFSGTLGLLRPSQASKEKDNKSKDDTKVNTYRPKIVWFKPTDKKVPLIAIPTEQAPKDFIQNHEKYMNQVFIASIKRWPITSLHPFGTLVSQLGTMNEPEIEVDSILRDNNFLCDEYPDDDEKYLSDIPDIKSELELNRRRPFIDEYVIAYSQTGAFSDHAIHIKIISDTKIELGVHIADVTHFVKQGSSLDKRSKKRSHSVFLPQKAVHLFPQKVNDLISFNENQSNLAISVCFEIDSSTFEIDDVWMGESVVYVRQKVNYATVDSIVNKSNDESVAVDSATFGYISTLALISRGLRRKRLDNPKLENEPTLPLLDQLDDERVKLSLNIFQSIASTSLIDEIFHHVNAAVAQKVYAGLGDRALLRKYPIPTLTKFENYNKRAANLGVKLDTTNAATFQNSLLEIEDPLKRKAIEAILIKSMPRGKYIVAGKTDSDSLSHYLFNLPNYTHFTAPLRRYADLIVHRQLKAVLNNDIDNYKEDIDSLKMNSDYCNFKKDCAKAAQEQAIHLLLCQTINEMSEETGQILTMGTVIQVYESSFDVLLPEFGIEKRVHGDQLPLRKAEFDKYERVLELYWEPGLDSATYIPEDENEPLSYRASIKNKFRSPSTTAAKVQSKSYLENTKLISDELAEKLASLNLEPPKIEIPNGDPQPERPPAPSTKSMPETPQRPPIEVRGNEAKTLSHLTLPASALSTTTYDAVLSPYLKHCLTRMDSGDHYIQEIREMKQVPILLRSEVGMALPCLTVRTLNPFSSVKKSS
ncbi:hypothetical protein CANARDRAFT_198387 [[Candida] arabinofermentans NRRL YB-2248]|uniref:RNB domain-containing protein n=1 Tax=[Candida] arabinofermentans NRRL YB-2248 TaxID=983967 RepID=A0A1E4T168_9ASCO|nr:hypothetical protein CANARDRAFT_198387 [[Candida] arabinofermentans NRRL YB-2248]